MSWQLERQGERLRYAHNLSPNGEVLTYETRERAEQASAYLETDYGEPGWEPVESTETPNRD